MKKYFLLINLLLLFFSCELRYNNCSIKVENKYFERINNICIGNIDFGSLSVGEVTAEKEFESGTYNLSILTDSNIKLTAILNLEAERNVKIIINKEGRILLD